MEYESVENQQKIERIADIVILIYYKMKCKIIINIIHYMIAKEIPCSSSIARDSEVMWKILC